MYMLSLNYRPRNPLWSSAASAMTTAGGKGAGLFPCLATSNQADDATLDRWRGYTSRAGTGRAPGGCWPGALPELGGWHYRDAELASSDQAGISKAGVEAGPLLAGPGEAEDRRRYAGLQPTWADKSKGHAGAGRVGVP